MLLEFLLTFSDENRFEINGHGPNKCCGFVKSRTMKLAKSWTNMCDGSGQDTGSKTDSEEANKRTDRRTDRNNKYKQKER